MYAVIIQVGHFSKCRGKQYRKVTADMLQSGHEPECVWTSAYVSYAFSPYVKNLLFG